MLKTKQETAIKLQKVSKSFQSGKNVVHALRDVNFHTNKGELLMIVGPSGCGKTTLISLIAGALRPDVGEIEVYGNKLHQMRETEITEFRKKNIGFIFQQFHLIKTLNILENVSIPLILNGYSRSVAFEKADEMLAKVGLKGRGTERTYNLSGGQQQRVAVARALVHEPMLLMCDEPTSALDAETGGQVLELIQEIACSPNRAVIIVTHDNRIFKYADRIVTMNDGKVIGEELRSQ